MYSGFTNLSEPDSRMQLGTLILIYISEVKNNGNRKKVFDRKG